MNEIIVDFDSTVGLAGRPMDDALALLYLLGRPEEARVVGVTCTFGNDTAGQVYRSTQDFLAQVRPELPFFPGSEAGEDPRSPAARFLARAVRERPGSAPFWPSALSRIYTGPPCWTPRFSRT